MPRHAELSTVYAQYLAAFNARDRDAVWSHLAPDLVFDWGGAVPTLVGRTAFDDFFATLWVHLREHVVATDVEIVGTTLTARITNHINVTRDWPDSPLFPMTAGDSFTVAGPMAYEFDGRLISRITDLTPSTPTDSQEIS